MNENWYGIWLLGSLLLLFVMRWAHRCWGKALLATLFLPLVGVPTGFLAFAAVTVILRGLNSILAFAGLGLPISVLSPLAGVLTGGILLTIAILYLRDQRHLSQIETGPRLGVRYHAPKPDINLRKFPR